MSVVNKQEYIYDHIKKPLRENVILMGDIIEDSYIAREDNHDTILKIGFLNEVSKIEQ